MGDPVTLITMISPEGAEGAFVFASHFGGTASEELCLVYLIGLESDEVSDIDAPLFQPLCRREAIRAAGLYAARHDWELTQIRCLRPPHIENYAQ